MISVRGIFSGFLRMLNIEVGILFTAVDLFFFLGFYYAIQIQMWLLDIWKMNLLKDSWDIS